jgi:MFS family permease
MTAVSIPPFARDRRIQAWAVCSGISAAGDTAWLVALAWTATAIAGPGSAGLMLGAGTLPRAIVSLYGGALADRLDTRRVMVLTNLGRIAVLLVAAACAWWLGLTVPLLLSVSIVFGCWMPCSIRLTPLFPDRWCDRRISPRQQVCFKSPAELVGSPVVLWAAFLLL